MYSVRHPARRYDREYIAYPISVFSLCVAGLICRCGSVGKHGGFCFFSFPAVSMISCPHPPPSPPSPSGKGGSPKVYFAGGFAPGTPALNRLRHLQTLPYRCPAGGLPGRSPARPALSFICCPHPPRPLPPPGKGESQSLFRRGLRPRHPCTESPTALADAAVQVPGGGLPSRSPARPTFSFISFPHPPAPLPVGKGAFSFLMQGASPLASPGAEPMVCCKPDRKQFPASGAARVQPPGTTAAKSISAANGLMPGCRGRSPRRNKVIFSPFPAGRGSGG